VDAHHIRRWPEGDPTDLDNLVILCRRHHRAVHEGGYGISLLNGIATVRRPDGTVLERVVQRRAIAEPSVLADNHDHGLDITPDAPVALWDGLPFDYADAVEGLLAS